MRRPWLLVILTSLAGCVSPREDGGSKIRAASVSGVCHVHDLAMTKKTVPIEYGLPAAQPSAKVELAKFPFARRFVLGGCEVIPNQPRTTETFVCSACLEAERRWIAAHPNDPWSRQRNAAGQ